jgi:hypothetical protein
MTPKLGDIVLYTLARGEPDKNAARQHPAIVTAVHSETCVNLMVFCDNGQAERWTSVERQGTGDDGYGFWEPKE